MNERELNRLSYLFGSICVSPDLSERFLAVCVRNGSFPALDAVAREIKGWVADHGPMTREGLETVAAALSRSAVTDEARAAQVLLQTLSVYP